MRIIAGSFKGRRLTAPTGIAIRPTSDGLRETLFNVIGDVIEGARVLDVCAGTGAVGLEALSRGADHATFVERDAHALRALEGNIRLCGAEEACAIIRDDFSGFGRRATQLGRFDLVFLDPPYAIETVDEFVALAAGFVAPAGQLVFEHSRRRASPDRAANLGRSRVLTAGDSALSFYAPVP